MGEGGRSKTSQLREERPHAGRMYGPQGNLEKEDPLMLRDTQAWQRAQVMIRRNTFCPLSRGSPEYPEESWNQQGLFQKTIVVRKLLSRHGGEKPTFKVVFFFFFNLCEVQDES